MKGYRFYREHETPTKKRKGEHTGNVVAVWLEEDQPGHWRPLRGGQPGEVEAFVGVLGSGDSPICGSAVARTYLSTRCTRIGEAEARTIHPELFRQLDRIEQEAEAEDRLAIPA